MLQPTPLRHELIFAPGSPIEALLRSCERVAAGETTVLLTGETGTGKEVVARTIHQARGQGAFVPVNCGAIPDNLLEAELFGHARGAFTGAVGARKGRVAMAEGGTLFLDEVGELPLPLQVKLLRLLQERTYEPVGSDKSVVANFRLIAATNRDLAAEVAAGRFREDLYYRLFVFPVELPPLRARQRDIPTLAMHFWQKLGEQRPLEDDLIKALMAYPWPGNIRELQNLMERLSVCAEGTSICASDLPPAYQAAAPAFPEVVDVVTPSAPQAPTPAPFAAAAPLPPQQTRPTPPLGQLDPSGQVSTSNPIDLPALLKAIEWDYIDTALALSGGNKQSAARMLGLRRTTLVEKLRRRSKHSGEGAPVRQSLGDRATDDRHLGGAATPAFAAPTSLVA